MSDLATPSAHNLTTPYVPVALYYEDADSLEYIRRDVPAVYRRIDELLTLVYDMENRSEIIGFQIKGFRHFYLSNPVSDKLGDFVSLVGLIEHVMTVVAGAVFDHDAYERARKIALEDKVEVHDLPRRAAN